MDHFETRNGELHAEAVPATELAQRYGTPLYVYSRATLERHYHAFDQALEGLDHQICFAVKANSNLAVLNVLARLGSGFDIVSGGELERVIAAGGEPKKVVFSGVGKTRDEIARALEVGIGCFNVESEAELDRINEVAGKLGYVAPVSIRVNPDVDAQTHPYISTGLKENKFGIDIARAPALYASVAQMPNINIIGVDCHIGSQLTQLAPFLDAQDRVLALIDRLAADGITIEHVDMGGGLGVPYTDEQPPSPAEYGQALRERFGNRPLKLLIEPGRAIAANAGILLTKVEHLKSTETHNFAIVDAAMNDLLRPALYSAIQQILPVKERAGETTLYDIVGPVCETGDFLGKGRTMNLAEDDLLAVRSSGAYGFVMSSNYNSRPRAAEVLVDGANAHLVRERETTASLFDNEHLLPDE